MGLNIILSTLQLLLLVFICVWEANKKSSAAFLWATLLIMFGLMHFLSIVTGMAKYSVQAQENASLFVIIFCFIYYISRLSLISLCPEHKNYMFQIKNELYEKNNVSTLLLIVFIIASVGRVLSIIRGSGGIMNTSWSSMREVGSTAGYINSGQLFQFIYYSFSGLMFCYYCEKKIKCCAITIFCMLFSVVVGWNRVFIIPLLIQLVLIVLIKKDKVDFKFMLYGLIVASVFIFIIYGMRAIRFQGTISNLINNSSANDIFTLVREFIKNDDGELGLRNVFLYFVENNNNFQGFGTGATYIRCLFVFIPTRWSFGLKPEDFALTMGAAVGMATGGSMHPTLFGDCFANLGWFGVLLGAFWAVIASLGDRMVCRFRDERFSVFAYVLFSSMYVIIGRGAVYSGFSTLAWGILILKLFSIVYPYLPRIVIGSRRL